MKPFNLSLGCDLVWDSVGSFIGCELCSTTRSMWGIPRQAGASAEVAYPHLAKALLGFPLLKSSTRAPQLVLFCVPRTLGGSGQPGCLGHGHPKRAEIQMSLALRSHAG